MGVIGFMHRIENPAVHGLETIAQIRDCTADNHAHGIVKIGGFHLLRNADRRAVIGGGCGSWCFAALGGECFICHFGRLSGIFPYLVV